MFPPQSILNFFRQLDARRPGLVSTARCLGFEPQGTNDSNVSYFAMEYLEQRYVRYFLASLSQTKELHSVVLVHDGLYLSPSPSHDEVARASEAAATTAGLPTLQLNLKDLYPLWQRQFGNLDRQTVAQQAQAKRRRLAAENGTGTDNIPNSHVNTGYVLHFVPQTRKLVRKRAHIHVEPPSNVTLTPPKTRKITYTSQQIGDRMLWSLILSQRRPHSTFSKKRLFGE